MERLKTRKFAGIELGKEMVRLSIFDEGPGEMTEESFPLYAADGNESAQTEAGSDPGSPEADNGSAAAEAGSKSAAAEAGSKSAAAEADTEPAQAEADTEPAQAKTDTESAQTEADSEPAAAAGENEENRFIRAGLRQIRRYMECNKLTWQDFQDVNFAIEDPSPKNRRLLNNCVGAAFTKVHKVNVLTRFRAFVEYVFHQERAVWDRNTLLLDFADGKLSCIYIEQIRRARQKAYRAVLNEINTEEYDIQEGGPDLDYNFSRMMKQFLAKHPAYIIYLTGKGFEGNWMKRTLNHLCAGRRVFMGQNLYANGACLLGIGPVPLMDEGMILMQGPEMVRHTIGVICQENGKARYVPVAPIGKEWYNTRGSIDIIMDKSQKIEFFYHNSAENEMECTTCEIRDLPKRPPKTTRLHLQVDFTSPQAGVILITDMGFGSMFPATGKVTVFPFQLIG